VRQIGNKKPFDPKVGCEGCAQRPAQRWSAARRL